MESSEKKILLRIGGMSCVNCQKIIERTLVHAAGVQFVKVDYASGIANVTYDANRISRENIIAMIEKLDYRVLSNRESTRPNFGRVAGTLAMIVALYVLLQQFGILNLLVPSQLANAEMGYGMLFIIGLITSVHCIAMCGGINLSQCIPRSETQASHNDMQQRRVPSMTPALLYNLGRVISYTALGFILGFVGLLFGGGTTAGLPAVVQGVLKLAAGVFMVIMGINILGIIPQLRKLQFKMPAALSRKVNAEKARSKSPLIVGLLNGLMPCGPLQSMQIVALASGNPFTGALSMLLFSLGTVPLMLGLGSIVSALGRKFTHKVMSVGAVLVVVLGLAMLSQGGSLSGLLPPDLLLPVIVGLCAIGIVSSIPFPKSSHRTFSTITTAALAVAAIGMWSVSAADSGSTADSNAQIVDGKQVITSTLSSGSYPDITVQAGTPVKWIINAPQGSINGCNYKVNIQEYGITNYAFQSGENTIEFTPSKTGKFQYSCWMGMIHGTITVTDGDAVSPDESSNGAGTGGGYGENAASSQPVPAGYQIPTDSVAVAEETTYEGYPVQKVTIELTDEGFRPAIVVIQSDLYVLWDIKNTASGAEKDTQLLVPSYAAQLPLSSGDNPLSFEPADSFDFSTADNAFYGYAQVVDDLKTADLAAIKAAVGNFQTMIWPPETFQTGSTDGGTSTEDAAVATVKDGVQYVTSTMSAGEYQPIRVQQGIPVKWTLNAPDGSLTGCNNSVVVPEYNLKVDLKTGENVIEFTPDKSGSFAFSCWMGMVRSNITVVGEDGTVAATQDDGSDQLPSCCGG